MASRKDQSWLERVGCEVSAIASDVSAHPFAQIGIILFCALWWIVGLPTDVLTAALSILAITLTQMVLNRQKDRELEAHRRDVAMHAKLDELVLSSRRARNEFVGIEDELQEEEIVELKHEAMAAIDDAAAQDPEGDTKEVARQAVELATERVANKASRRKAEEKAAKSAGASRK